MVLLKIILLFILYILTIQLCSAASYLSMPRHGFHIKINSLLSQNTFDTDSEKRDVYKANNRNPIGLVNANDISQLALERWDDASAQNHHD